MNWGGFADGFSRGFNNGVNMGTTLKKAIDQKKLDDVRAQGIAEAKAAQEQAINSAVRENGMATQAVEPTAVVQGQPAPDAQPAAPAPAAPTATPDTTAPAAAPANPAPATAPPVDASLAGAPKAISAPEATGTPAPAPDAQPAPRAQGMAAAPKKFTVYGKGFDDHEEALKYARAHAPSVMDFMGKTMVPKMQEAYLAQGDVEKAEAWGKWAKERANQKNMETWAKAYRAAQAGDWEGAAEHFVELHNNFDDGLTVTGKPEIVKDKAGNVTGFNVKLKDDASGEARSQFIDRNALVESGLSALSPPALFEQTYKRKAEADALAAKARIDAAKDARTYQRDMGKQQYIEDRADKRAINAERLAAAKDERQHRYKLDELATAEDLKQAGYGAQEKAKLQAEIDLARAHGFSDDEIKGMVRQKLGGGYKKTTDPTERRALVISDLMKNDPTFVRAKPDEQEAKVQRMMTLTYGDQGGAPNQSKPPAQPDAGLAIGAPAPQGLADGAYRDQKTGQPFRVKGGKIVPLQ